MSTSRLAVFAAAALGAASIAAPLVLGPAQAQAQGAPGQSPEAVFNARCKACHEPPVERAISREAMAQMAPEAIAFALTDGPMKPMAQGLAPEDVRALAVYLAGKPMSATGPRTGGLGARLGQGGLRLEPPQGAAQPPGPACKSDPPIRPGPADWVGFGRDPAADRFQPHTAINAANVGRLKLKWSFAISGGRNGQPSVVGDRLFLTTGAGDAFSLDAATGCVHWQTSLGSGSRTSPMVVRVPGMGASGWVMFVGDFNRNELALDAKTGKILWKTEVQTHPMGVLTGGAAFHGGTVYVPLSSGEEITATTAAYSCCTFSGAVVAIDARTGKIKWRTAVLPKAAPTRKNQAGAQLFGPAGAAIWSQPSVDVKRGRIYVATGDSYTEVAAPASDSVVAFDAGSGKIDWVDQVTKADNFLIACGRRFRSINCPLGEIGPDHDFGASPIIARLPGGRDILLAGQKSGAVYGMDPASGKLLWTTKVGAGSPLGGVEWGMAYDGRALYVAISDLAVPAGVGKPGLYALDPATGKVLWSAPAPKLPCGFKAPRCSNAHSAPPAAAPGLVFTGSHDGWLQAYGARDGRMIWSYDTGKGGFSTVNGVQNQPGGSIDATGPVIGDGGLFVISGYNGATGAFGNPLNVLLAFTLDGK